MRKLLLSLLSLLSAGVLAAYSPAINDIRIDVSLSENGTAHIVEVWDVVVASGTEWYLVRNNLGDIEIKNLKVTDEEGTEFFTESAWKVDRDIRQKTHRCGINRTDSGCEICWGVGSYGPHVFTVSYDMTNVVKTLNDHDMLHIQFIGDQLSSNPLHAKLSLTAPVPLSEENSNIWAFGYTGTVVWDDGKVVAESGEPFDTYSSLILLLRFDKGIFDSPSLQDRDFTEVLDRAREGSYYPDEGPDPWYYTVLGLLVFVAMVWFAMIKPVVKFLEALDLKKRVDKKRRKEIFGVRNFPLKFDWCRDLPFGGDIYETYYIQAHLRGVDDRSYTILPAMLLRMIFHNVIQMRHDAKNKVEFTFNPSADLSYMSVPEKTFLDYLKKAAGEDNVLQEKEFKNWSNSHWSSMKVFMTTVQDKVLSKFSDNNYVSYKGGWYTIDLNADGRAAAMKALGFKQFLKDFTLVGERSSVEVGLWGDYLVHAAIFGIADKVAKEMSKIDASAIAKLPVHYSSLPAVVSFSDSIGRAVRNSYFSSGYSGYSSGMGSSSGSYGSGSRGGYGGSSSRGGGGGYSGGGHGGGSR
ncbi:MAG: DUF2207 domain-containing protein [Bacteroidales bacterium]|nr:DUF2207 domain-containing protein [Bacteroidales bacterium]